MGFSTSLKLDRPPKLSEQVTQFLSDEIAKGSFKPGENLPSEAKLASRFQVSRTIVREALARLEFEGIVESRRGTKAKIAPLNQRRTFRIESAGKMDLHELEQLYELRAIIEGSAASLAAKRRSDNDLSKIEDCLNVLIDTIQKGQPNLNHNVNFHQLVAAASHNNHLKNFMQFLNGKIWEQIQGDQKQRGPKIDKEAILETHQEHQSIFDAIAKGESKKAKEAIMKHISNAAKRRNIILDI
jgi:GntR family transcriptional repressor for pyruvate dehydrogenase complex